MLRERDRTAAVAALKPEPIRNWRLKPGVYRCVQTRPSEDPGVRIRRVHAIVNPASGGVESGAAQDLAAILADFGVAHRESELGRGRVRSVVQSAIDSGPDLVVVLGGDGTARLVAEMCGPCGPLVAPLSGGTMSKLERGLYGSGSWREALANLLTVGREQWVPGGEVAGRAFFCSAVLGPPALGARAREAVRAGRYAKAWSHAASAFRRTFMTRVRYQFDAREIGRGLAIGLICPTISRGLDEEEALEAAVLNVRDLRAAARLTLNHLFGDWRNDPDVTVRSCVYGQVWGREALPVMLDGEYFRFGRELEIRFLPRAFRALAPPPEPAP